MPTILPITDFLDPQLDIYARLSENQLLNRCDPQNGIFIAESPKVIERALDAGCIPISFLTEDRHLENQALPFLERCPDIPFFSAPFEVLTQLTGFALTRGMLCAMKRPKLPSVEELCQASSRLVILENIMNPTNIGAIFRSAAALGMDGVLLTSDCSNPLYRRAIRVSMGTVFQIPWTFLDSSWPLPGISEWRFAVILFRLMIQNFLPNKSSLSSSAPRGKDCWMKPSTTATTPSVSRCSTEWIP